MAKKLPRKPCPLCELSDVAYYPSSGVLVRHLRADGMHEDSDDGLWCPYPNQQRAAGEPPPDLDQIRAAQEKWLQTEEGRKWFNESRGGSAGPSPLPAATKTVSVSDLGELADWWRSVAEHDIARTIPKAEEYSAYDLELIGRSTVEMFGQQPWERNEADPAVYAEIGCWWYLLGKIGRAIGAIREGQMPSNDTVQDARIYATMIARIRQTGGWPGVH